MPQPVAVFGASGGFGAAIARRIARDHPLIVQGRDQARLAAVADEFDVPAYDRLVLDCGDETSVAAAVSDLSTRHGSLAGAVLSLGAAFPNKLTHRQSWATFADQIDIQLKTTHILATALKPLLAAHNGTARLVVIGTEFALATPPMKTAPYSAAKAAQQAYAQVIAQEWLKDGIRVHILAPGMAKTAMTADMPDAFLDQVAAGMPEKMLTRVEDVAEMAAFCLTDAADPLYGQPIRVSRAAR